MNGTSRNNGFTILELMIVITLIALVAAIAIPSMLSAMKQGNEGSAISSLRTIATSQITFREQDLDGDGTSDYASSLAEMNTAGLIDNVLSTGTKSGFTFEMRQQGSLSWNDGWSCVANPDDPGKTGDRYFYIDSTDVIRFNSTAEASASDPAIE